MTPETLTAIAAVVVSIISSFVVPIFLKRRAAHRAEDSTEVVSWKGITSVLQTERDDLRRRLETLEDTYKRRLNLLEEDYVRQLGDAKDRIKQLESEVADLYRRLYQQGASGNHP